MTPIIIERTGRNVLSIKTGNLWKLTLGGAVVGWASSYQAALAKQRRLESARGAGHAA